jgi:sentrin-specific protease 1
LRSLRSPRKSQRATATNDLLLCARFARPPTRYLKDEHAAKDHAGTFDENEWVLEDTDTSVTPQQQNGYDCGVFTCTCADFLSVGLPLDYSQRDIKEQRKRMVWKIMGVSLDA